jgi:murein DD-endopeptidase MepM/ murein hydrolase activator NlpD
VPKPTIAPGGVPAAPIELAANGPLPKIPAVAPAGSSQKPTATPAVANGTQIPATQASLTPKAALDPQDGPSANGTTFRWPVRGRVIAGFGSNPGGQRNDGINLAVPEGTSVKAAEAGTVIYAGNELEGYGNLILVRHADGWVSAYAHNKDLLVKRGDAVTRGQIIAHAGMTGSVSAPQVHFELRRGSKPVNPLDYLSG